MTGIFSHINIVGNALQAADLNHKVLSENLANVNTPGYKTKRLNFAEIMQRMDAKDQRELIDAAEVEVLEGLAERVDGNNVELERELSQIKKNAMAYQAYTQLLSSKIGTMRRAISG